MSRGWLTFWLVFVVLSWILSAVLVVAALAMEDYGKVGFNLALVLVNTWALGIIAGSEGRLMTPRPVPAPVSNTSAAAGYAAFAVTRMTAITREHGLTDVRAEVAVWRAVDRNYPPDTREWWDATLRLRDIADAADREARA